MKFDPPHAPSARLSCAFEADGKGERVEPQGKVRTRGHRSTPGFRPVAGIDLSEFVVGRFVFRWSLLGPHGDPSDTTSLPAERWPAGSPKAALSKVVKIDGSDS